MLPPDSRIPRGEVVEPQREHDLSDLIVSETLTASIDQYYKVQLYSY